MEKLCNKLGFIFGLTMRGTGGGLKLYVIFYILGFWNPDWNLKFYFLSYIFGYYFRISSKCHQCDHKI